MNSCQGVADFLQLVTEEREGMLKRGFVANLNTLLDKQARAIACKKRHRFEHG